MDWRAKSAVMMRVRNEARWIRRSLERTWQVASVVVLWDDGSTDETVSEALASLDGVESREDIPFGIVTAGKCNDLPCELHILHSPFARARRPKERVHEIRDKNLLWYYVKACIECEHVLCIDGDEMLSQKALRAWPEVIAALEQSADIVEVPFIYLWDREDRQRVDGIYGRRKDGLPHLKFPRVFTIKRVDASRLFNMHFEWYGNPGGFHCGSIPMESFLPCGNQPIRTFIDAPFIHFGYLHAEDRERKFRFYNEIDPKNQFEGEYLHIIGKQNWLCPGPLRLVPFEDV